MPVLIYNGARQHTVSVDRKTNVRLIPGKNIVEAKALEKLMDKKAGSPGFKGLVDDGEVEVLDDTVMNPDSGDLDITKMSAKEAKALVDAEPNLDALGNYLKAEEAGDNRPSVVKAINEAISGIKAADESGGSNDNE
ncbi:MAG: hypothetical protein SV201_13730 [Pseudomonadota bacterium]|nr:hypothetical protein [Pseudomonadota bacterium]